MVRVIDLDENGLSVDQVIDSIRSSEGALLRRDGRVIARLQAADDIDLDDELWAHEPEQLARGDAARQRLRRGESTAHDEVKRQLPDD